MEFEKEIAEYLSQYQLPDTIYGFVQVYNRSIERAKDYGNGELVNTIDAHLIEFVAKSKDVTVTSIAKEWGRTKGTISPQINRLVDRGYLRKFPHASNLKVFYLELTEKGWDFHKYHMEYDLFTIKNVLHTLLSNHTVEEIGTFHKVLETYKDIYLLR